MRQDFGPGARNAVRVCLNVSGADRVAVVRDRVCAEIADAIEEEVRATGAEIRSWTMEDHVKRPATEFPRAIADGILKFRPTASYFIGSGQRGELAFRQPMLHLLADQLGCRHGHMIGIDENLMTDGMAADYEEIYRVTQQVWQVVRTASRIEVATRKGTELAATFSRDRKWIPCDGRYWEQHRWGNLPEGETFTAPLSVDGVIAAEEMGDWFAAKYGLLAEPVLMRVKGGRLVSYETSDPQLRADIEAYMAQHPESNRVGEFAIGTNVGLTKIVGNFLQDEKFPGVHIAFGDPYGAHTGAPWKSSTHIDVVGLQFNIWLGDAEGEEQIMRDGEFLIDA